MKRILISVILVISASVAHSTTESATAEPSLVAPTKAELSARGQQIAGAVCVACHGLDGMSAVSANPNLAGMPSQYIAKQLELFKSGQRKNALMQGMSANLSESDMRALGQYYFMQRAKPNAKALNKELADAGQKIYRTGIPESKVPACSGCHGGAGSGIPALYPRLAGQWQEYTLGALKNFAAGERKNTQMQAISGRMREKEMQAVAEYIAGMRGG